LVHAIPSHVPAELVVDFDMRNVPGGQADMQVAWRQALGHHPLVYTAHNGGCWIPTSADILEEMYPDTVRLSNQEIFIPAHEGDRVLPGETDPPIHGPLRKALLAQLTASKIKNMESRIREFTIELIEEIRPAGKCDFISDFGQRLPIMLFLEIAGLPISDAPYLKKIADEVARGATAEIKNAAHHALTDYIADRVADRRSKLGDDLISDILTFRIDDRPLSETEVIGLCHGVFLGGLDTVASALGFVGRFLAENPDQRQYIRQNIANPTPIIDELLRRFSIVSLGRIVAVDHEYRGVLLKKGDRVMMPTFLHGLDPMRYESPEAVDFTRRGNNLAFGKGAHGCPGKPLARAELRIFLEEWLRLIPDFEVDPDQSFRILSGQVLAFERLPLRWAV
jgi:cytochrome P450